MVFRLVGLIGLILLPSAVAAEPVGVQEALRTWISDGGSGDTRYRVETGEDGTQQPPAWLLRPRDAAGPIQRLMQRGLYPEAATLDWREDSGPVIVFGRARPGAGLRLVVGRDCQCPLALETPEGVRWSFSDYRSRSGRATPVPQRVEHQSADGRRTAFQPRP